MVDYKLLTPGPLTTSLTVKTAMLVDHCTWDDDYKEITQDIRKSLLEIAQVDPDEYTCVLMQGSGTFGVEAMLTTLTSNEDKILIISNGKYGERIVKTGQYSGKNILVYDSPYDQEIKTEDIEKILEEDEEISHVIMVHSETTTGILNNIQEVGQKVKDKNKIFLVDAMSSFGGVEIDFTNIDSLVSSSNKCIEGVPGFSFVIVKKDLLEKCQGNATSLSLDLYDQYKGMENGKWRFTAPTHSVVAFKQAIKEYKEEGGLKARNKRYTKNQKVLAQAMKKLGFKTYISEENQGPIITTFLYPDNMDIDFKDMYDYIKDRGYAIYPGKLTDIDTFRIGNIGQVYEADMVNVAGIIEDYLHEKNYL